VVVLVTALVSLVLGLGLSLAAQDEAPAPGAAVPDPPLLYQGTKAPTDKATTDSRLGCTDLSEPLNFTAYSLGSKFQDLPVTAVIRRCDAPYPGEKIRANYVSYIYGDCEVTPDVDGCAPPLEVQTWPACERSLGDYETGGGAVYSPAELGDARGVPAETFDGDSRVELYTGNSTVVIFGAGKDQASEAIDSLRAEQTGSPLEAPAAPEPKASAAPASDLPSPAPAALQGELSCSA
jgi:hypothetical protein